MKQHLPPEERQKFDEAQKAYENRREQIEKDLENLPRPRTAEDIKQYNARLEVLNRENPNNAHFYDENEPEWMKNISLSTRQCAREKVTMGTYKEQLDSYLSGTEGNITGDLFLGVLAIIADTSLFGSYKLLSYLGATKICLIPLFAIAPVSFGAIALRYSSHTDAIAHDKAKEANFANYRDKSMEYILREAHTKGYYNSYTPTEKKALS